MSAFQRLGIAGKVTQGIGNYVLSSILMSLFILLLCLIACTLPHLLGWHISLIAIGTFILVTGIVIIIIIFIVVVRHNGELSVNTPLLVICYDM